MILREGGAESEAAFRLAALLARPHVVTVIQVVRPTGLDVALQSITTLHSGREFLVAVSPGGTEGPTAIQSATVTAIHDSMLQMLSVPLR